jgi:hypothetical protein
MFEYVKVKLIKLGQNQRWIMNQFAGKNKILDCRRVRFKSGALGNHQIKHPNYNNWFDVPADFLEIQNEEA